MFRDTPLEFYTHKKQKKRRSTKVSTVLPCDCHVAGRCSIFPNRPRTCSTYSCNLLDKMFNGEVDPDTAFRVVDITKGQFEWLREFATTHGYFTRERKSLKKVIDDFFESALARAKHLPLFDAEIEFALKSFEYLQNIDRYFEDRSVYEFGSLVGSLKSEKEINPSEGLAKQYLSSANGNHVELVNCSEVSGPLARMIRGYINDADCDRPEGGQIELRIWKIAGRYHWDTPYPGPHSKPETELNDLDAVLSDIHYHADHLFAPKSGSFVHLHAAAVELPAGTVLLLGGHEAGKTIMSLAFAAGGYRILGDDQIAIDLESREAVSMGRIPLLRLSSDNDGEPTENLRYLEYDGYGNDRYFRFVDLPEQSLAPIYARSGIAGAVILNRSGKAGKESIEKSSGLEVLKRLLDRSDNLDLTASERVKGLSRVAESIACYELDYEDAESAVPLIEECFRQSSA